jgi:hypothetical protein
MKTNFIKTIGLIFFISSLSLNAISQIDRAKVDDLNKVLKGSLYKTTIKIDDKGVVKVELFGAPVAEVKKPEEPAAGEGAAQG